jgi:hypothetical protein
MRRTGSLARSVPVAAVLAGPIFVLTTAAASLYLQLPAAIVITPAQLLMLLVLLMPAAIIGAMIGLPINAMGAALMAALGKRFAFARSPIMWSFAGALVGTAAACGLDMGSREAPFVFGLIATSALCGWLCSRGVAWVEGE